ncbi:TetR/AcrR family transcriptional regulator [Ramlibacter sp.]|uniref:TetR/AcrR family transcriptional regulator n=1 Tax=Ramlibacter sp. TaxID=1917967 RepID=UPI0018083256|nr:TetR/AcrR family transcriptional regulator [Ramlibacter sp.]MBA2672186.1 TetR/AcrR family transcriptional regulator [Ramlibacter sp.]
MAKTAAKRTNDPEGTRRRVLDVAALAFQAGGYHATSVHDIVALAEVSPGALHHHFASKKAIGLAVIQERIAQTIYDTWTQPVAGARTAFDGVLAVMDSIAQSLDARGTVLGCPLNNMALELAPDPDFRPAIQALFAEWTTALERKLVADGAAASGAEAHDLALMIVASYSGAIGMAKAAQASEPLKACRRQLARLAAELASGMAPPAPASTRRPGSAPRRAASRRS